MTTDEQTVERGLAGIRSSPDDPNSWIRLGLALKEIGELDEALGSFRRAVEIRPTDPIGLALSIEVARAVCDWDTAWSAALRAVAHTLTATPATLTQPAVTPFTSLLFPLGPEPHRRIAIDWVRHRFPRSASPRPAQPRSETDRLRIGYVSGDLRNHPVAHLCHRLFEHHDRSRFEVYVYSTGPNDNSSYRHHVIEECDRFVDLVDLDDDAAGRVLRHDRLDVLIDMSGHTAFGRLGLLAGRPAPVQMHFLGYPGTTGAPFVDWFVTDMVASPPGAAAHFTERLIRMPHTYQVNAPVAAAPDPPRDRRSHGLPESGVVFSSFNSSYKIDPATFDAWMHILRSVPDARLWIVTGNRFVEPRLRRESRLRGVDDARLVFADRVGRRHHLARHRAADVALDPLHVCGHTTTSDALRMGLPVVTRPGESFISRVSASLLTAVGADDLVCHDTEAYVARAVSLGRSAAERTATTQRLRDGVATSPLFDTVRYVRALETAIETAWELHQRGDRRSAISVTARD